MTEPLTLFVSLALGIGLSAAAGFRVFVPLLVLGAASFWGVITPMPELAWVGTVPALVTLGVATVLEIGAYHVPWLDHALDVIASPSAVIAGILLSAAVLSPELDPGLRWGLAIVAGGGAALATQSSTVLLRAASTAMTGGLANPLIAFAEAGVATVLSVVAILVPLAALGAVIVGAVLVGRFVMQRTRRVA